MCGVGSARPQLLLPVLLPCCLCQMRAHCGDVQQQPCRGTVGRLLLTRCAPLCRVAPRRAVLQAEREQLQEQLAAGAAEREDLQKKLQKVNNAGLRWKNTAEAEKKNVAQLEQQLSELQGKVTELEAAAAAAAPAAAAGATDLQRFRQAAVREKKRADAAEKVCMCACGGGISHAAMCAGVWFGLLLLLPLLCVAVPCTSAVKNGRSAVSVCFCCPLTQAELSACRSTAAARVSTERGPSVRLPACCLSFLRVCIPACPACSSLPPPPSGAEGAQGRAGGHTGRAGGQGAGGRHSNHARQEAAAGRCMEVSPHSRQSSIDSRLISRQ